MRYTAAKIHRRGFFGQDSLSQQATLNRFQSRAAKMTGSFSATVCSGDGVMLGHLCLALPCGYGEGVGTLYIHVSRYSVYVYIYIYI